MDSRNISTEVTWETIKISFFAELCIARGREESREATFHPVLHPPPEPRPMHEHGNGGQGQTQRYRSYSKQAHVTQNRDSRETFLKTSS